MSLFAKDLDYLEVSAADFLPDDNKLFIVVADSECNLYILQYDPEGKPYTAEKTPILSFLTNSRPQLLQRRQTPQPQQIPHRQLHLNRKPPPPHPRLL
jgi:hypothetical protein